MDAIFSGISALLGKFTDPTQIVLLLVSMSEGFAIYKLVAFLMQNYKESIQNDLRNAQAIEGVLKFLEKGIPNGKP